MSDQINAVSGDKSHLYGAGAAGAYMAMGSQPDYSNVNPFTAKERDVDLSGVSAFCNPRLT